MLEKQCRYFHKYQTHCKSFVLCMDVIAIYLSFTVLATSKLNPRKLVTISSGMFETLSLMIWTRMFLL